MKKKIALLMTVHNRSEKTVRCLQSLYNCPLPEHSELRVFMVNDGCTDDTESRVAGLFPDVHIIKGDGNLFWNRGMRLAWTTAAQNDDFDFYVWLNDDVILFENAIRDLIVASAERYDRAIVCGTTCAPDNHSQITYGGRIKSVGIAVPNGQLQSCDCCNGQLCCIPKAVFKVMGMNDPLFHHGFGDWDYGFRAKKKGFEILVAPAISGACDVNRNDEFPPYLNPSDKLRSRLKLLYSPLGKNPYQAFVYTFRHNSLISAVITVILLHSKVIFPKKIKKTHEKE